MAYEQITPECRYGHGRLDESELPRPDDGSPARAVWGVPAFKISRQDDSHDRHTAISIVFTHRIFVCPRCGYMELFDQPLHRDSE